MNDIKHLFQLLHTDLTGCGGFGGSTEGEGRAKAFSGETADNAGSGHRHGDDRTVGVMLLHFQRK